MITYDAKNSEQIKQMFSGKNPVGILEVEDGQKDKRSSFGIQIGETRGQNLYCTAFLADDGTVLTSGECLAETGGKGTDPRKLKFYLRVPGSDKTEKFSIFAVRSHSQEDNHNLTVLVVDHARELINTFGQVALREGNPTTDDLKKDLSGLAIVADSPNGSGQVAIRVINVDLSTSAKITTAAEDLYQQRMAALPPADRSNDAISSQQRAAAEAEAPQVFNAYQAISLKTDEATGQMGAPILVGSRLAGIVFSRREDRVIPDKDETKDDKVVANYPQYCQWLPAHPTAAQASLPSHDLTHDNTPASSEAPLAAPSPLPSNTSGPSI